MAIDRSRWLQISLEGHGYYDSLNGYRYFWMAKKLCIATYSSGQLITGAADSFSWLQMAKDRFGRVKLQLETNGF